MEKFIIELSPEEEALRQVIEPLLASEGYELVCLRLNKRQSSSRLALFVDTVGPLGIVLENLEDVSRLLSDVLDAAFAESSVLGGKYDLEVSSPGLDRPLSKMSHFMSVVGQKIKVVLREAGEGGAKKLLGVLREAGDCEIVIDVEDKNDKQRRIRYDNIVDANMIFDFSNVEDAKKIRR